VGGGIVAAMADAVQSTAELPRAGEPDPTELTTKALHREIAYMRDLLQAQAENARDLALTLRESDEKFENERDRRITEVKAESDRRLTEVATEREKALKIKEEADKEALRLDREIRQFKDDKASARTDAAVAALEQRLRPIDSFVSGQQGEKRQRDLTFGQLIGLATVVLFFLSVTAAVVALILHG